MAERFVMKVRDMRKYIADYDDDADIIASWMLRTENEEEYNDNEKLSDDVWTILLEQVSFDGDALYSDIAYSKHYIKELDENSQ